MIVIKAAIDCIRVYQLADQKLSYLGFANELDISEYDEKQLVLLTDYDTYLAPDKGMDQLIRDLAQLQIKPTLIYSPYEVIGAHLKEALPGINGEIQVLDIEPGYLHTFTIEFVNDRYTLKKGTKPHVKREIGSIFSDCLNITASRVNEFDLFLNTVNKEGRTYGYTVWDAIQHYEKTGEKLDHLFKAFDVNEWSQVTISQLLDLREQLLRLSAIDVKKTYRIVGLLGVLFSDEYNARHRHAGVCGAGYLCHHSNDFYAPLASDLTLEAYCYPDVVKLPLYTANSSYSDYKKTKQVQLCESGKIIFYRDNDPLPISTGSTETKQVELNIRLDGNQNLVVSVGKQTYLIP